MIASVVAALTGGIAKELFGSLERWQRAKLDAKNDAERIEADKQVAFFQGQISLAVAAAQNDKWWSTRELIGKCALVYVFKIVVWDTVLGLGITPDPGPQVTGIVMLVLGFYYGSKAAMDIASRILARLR
jgi:hypothetical protein